MSAVTEDPKSTDYTDSAFRSDRAGDQRKTHHQDNLSVRVIGPTQDSNLRIF
jgi:hypothetical protein